MDIFFIGGKFNKNICRYVLNIMLFYCKHQYLKNKIINVEDTMAYQYYFNIMAKIFN